jgi:hypothetical protein
MVYMREGLKRVRVIASIYYNNSIAPALTYSFRDYPGPC